MPKKNYTEEKQDVGLVAGIVIGILVILGLICAGVSFSSVLRGLYTFKNPVMKFPKMLQVIKIWFII